MDYDRIDYDRPIRLKDSGLFVILADKIQAGGGDAWCHMPDGSCARFSIRGGQIKYPHETAWGFIENIPEIDWKQPLYWHGTDDRGFVRGNPVMHSGMAIYEVDTPSGNTFSFRSDGVPLDHNRTLSNMTFEQQAAAARVAIKKAQRERAAQRARDAMQELADSNPMFGMF